MNVHYATDVYFTNRFMPFPGGGTTTQESNNSRVKGATGMTKDTSVCQQSSWKVTNQFKHATHNETSSYVSLTASAL